MPLEPSSRRQQYCRQCRRVLAADLSTRRVLSSDRGRWKCRSGKCRSDNGWKAVRKEKKSRAYSIRYQQLEQSWFSFPYSYATPAFSTPAFSVAPLRSSGRYTCWLRSKTQSHMTLLPLSELSGTNHNLFLKRRMHTEVPERISIAGDEQRVLRTGDQEDCCRLKAVNWAAIRPGPRRLNATLIGHNRASSKRLSKNLATHTLWVLELGPHMTNFGRTLRAGDPGFVVIWLVRFCAAIHTCCRHVCIGSFICHAPVFCQNG